MSHQHLEALRGIKLKGPGKVILLALADRCDTAGLCWPSISTIADDTGLGRSTVKKHLKSLRESGLLIWTNEFTNKGDKDSNRYILTLGGGSPDSPPRSRGNPPGSPGSSPVGHQVADGGSPGGHKASIEAPIGSTIETILPAVEELGLELERSDPGEKATIAEQIYQEYPRKVAKQDAIKAIKKALKRNDPEMILRKVKEYAEAITWQESRFIPYPATWFNSERFNDDPAEWRQPIRQNSTTNQPINHDRKGLELKA